MLGRVVGPGEPRWLPDDLAWAKALLVVEAEECPGCGHPKAVTTRVDSDGAYQVHLARCHACAAKDDQVRSFLKAEGDAVAGSPAGLLVSVHRRT